MQKQILFKLNEKNLMPKNWLGKFISVSLSLLFVLFFILSFSLFLFIAFGALILFIVLAMLLSHLNKNGKDSNNNVIDGEYSVEDEVQIDSSKKYINQSNKPKM